MLRDRLGKELLFFDGGMGTLLQEKGLQPGELPEVWNLEHAEEVIAISESFGIPAQIVGRIEACDQTELIIKSEFGEFRY